MEVKINFGADGGFSAKALYGSIQKSSEDYGGCSPWFR